MRKNLAVGILRETKAREFRAPLVPEDVKWLVKRNVTVEVESNPERAFTDTEYRKAGAKVVERFRRANFLLGIKNPDADNLYAQTIYMVFSHTIKGQFGNMPLLKECLKKKITLIDYEKIADVHGKRLVYFGRFAGICGFVDSLHYFGQKLLKNGIHNPFLLIRPAYTYNSLRAIKHAMVELDRDIVRHGFKAPLSPFIIGITGHGNVSKGVEEMIALLNPLEIHPQNMPAYFRHQKGMQLMLHKQHKLYKIVFLREEKFRSKNGGSFYYEDYLKNPKKFESNLDVYLPYLNMLIHGSYWDKRFPRLVTKKMVNSLAKRKPFRLNFIADISCDIGGSIELTHRATSHDNPVFTYDLKTRQYIDGYTSDGITVLAIDNLPAELPKDASTEFSRIIREYVYAVAVHGVKDITNHYALPREIRDAVIVQRGVLMKKFRYLRNTVHR